MKFEKNYKWTVKRKLVAAMILITLIPGLLAGVVNEVFFYNIVNDQSNDFSSYTNLFISYFLKTDEIADELEKTVNMNLEPEMVVKKLNRYFENEGIGGGGFLVYINEELYYQSAIITDKKLRYEYVDDEVEDYWIINDRYYEFRNLELVYSDGSELDVLFVLDDEYGFREISKFWISYALYYIVTLTLLILSILWWIKRSIDKPLASIQNTASSMKYGDLDSPLIYDEDDEFSELAHGIEELRKSLKESLIQQKKLEEEKSQIIRNVSHDLRTPLTAIRGYVQGIKDGVAKDPETIGEYLDTIQMKADAIDSLINDLKVLSDLDDEIEDYQFQKMNIIEFLSDCVDDMSFDIKQLGGNIKLDDVNDTCEIEADPLKLKRVFTNIIENSMKYRGVESLEIRIGVQCEEDHVSIRVVDNGIGLDKGLKDLIFERFFRADQSRSSDTGGSGIGLSICKDIVAKHQGTVEAFPGVDQGLTIEVSFPLRRK